MNRRGFTLIELLIVVAIIGLIATIALPRVFHVKERAQIAAMKSDLRNLVTVQEAYFAEHLAYATDPGATYHVSEGNNPPAIALTGDGWTATLTSTATDQQCGVFVGSTAVRPATREGVPACEAASVSATPLP